MNGTTNVKSIQNSILRSSVYVASATFWVILIGGFSFTLIEALLSFSYLIITPLALSLVKTVDRKGKTFISYQVAVKLGPLAAVLGSMAFIFSPSWESVLLSGIWLIYTLLIAFYGVVRLAERGYYPLEEMAIDIGLIYLAIGGVWQTIYHTGYDFMQFGSTIISLTAVHFHYSSFVVPIFIGLLGRMMTTEEQELKGYKWLTLALLISPMGIAIGITYSRWLEFMFVLLFVLALWRYSWVMFSMKQLSLKENRLAGWILKSSAFILLGTMLLSFVYGFGRILQISTISIPTMVLFHGIGNAFGFVLLGLIGWRIIQPEMKGQPYGIPFSQIRGKGKIGHDFLQRYKYVDMSERAYKGLVDDMSIYDRTDFNSANIHPLIREFYEDTLSFELKSTTKWAKGFRLPSMIYAWISKKIGQLHLLPEGKHQLLVDSTIIPVDDLIDGRNDVRAWIRTERGTRKTIFVALYSDHHNDLLRETYMNIGLPLPFSQMTGILCLEHYQENRNEHVADQGDNKIEKKTRKQGLILTSVPRQKNRGDEGIYLVTKWFNLRLPLNEHFVVNVVDSETLEATHHMWLCGYPLLTINYIIRKKSSQDL